MQIPNALIIIGGFAVIGTFVLHVVVGTIIRLRNANAPSPAELAALDARLERIEAAVQSLALEVEHSNELQRLSARVADTPRRLERHDFGHITPH